MNIKELLKKCDWNQISISKYEKIKEKIEKMDTENADNISTDAALEMMSLIYEVDKTELLNLDIKTFNILLNKVLTLQKIDTKQLHKTYKLNGNDYAIGMKYNIWTGEFDIKTDQYLTFMNVLRENPDSMAALLATILVPKCGRFNDGYSLLRLRDDISEHLNVSDGASIIFFLNSMFLTISKRRLEAALKQAKRASSKSSSATS